MTPELEYWRERIDATDRKIVDLLNERTRIVGEVARVKHGLNLPVFDHQREAQVFANATDRNPGPLAEDSVKLVFAGILEEMRMFEQTRIEEAG